MCLRVDGSWDPGRPVWLETVFIESAREISVILPKGAEQGSLRRRDDAVDHDPCSAGRQHHFSCAGNLSCASKSAGEGRAKGMCLRSSEVGVLFFLIALFFKVFWQAKEHLLLFFYCFSISCSKSFCIFSYRSLKPLQLRATLIQNDTHIFELI